MRNYTAGQTIKTIGVFLILLLLFPYIVSVFVNGPAGTGTDDDQLRVKVKRENGGEENAEIEIGWTDYLAGILAFEMPEGCGDETARALAVLIRTRLYRDAGAEDGAVPGEFFLTADEMVERKGEQGRKIFDAYTEAVEDTDDTVLMYKDTYAWTPYHQSSSGKTRDPEEVLGTDAFPYIGVRDCPLDKEADGEIREFTFSCTEIQKLCQAFLVAEEDGETAGKGYSAGDIEILSRDSAGYVNQIRIGSTVCTGDQFRDALSLPSGSFTVNKAEGDEQSVQITTTGKGHGLGLSIWTAEQMAGEGKGWKDILNFFFEGTELRTDIPENEIFGD